MGHLRLATTEQKVWEADDKRAGVEGELPGHRRSLPLSEPSFQKNSFGMLRPIFRQLHTQKYSTYENTKKPDAFSAIHT